MATHTSRRKDTWKQPVAFTGPGSGLGRHQSLSVSLSEMTLLGPRGGWGREARRGEGAGRRRRGGGGVGAPAKRGDGDSGAPGRPRRKLSSRGVGRERPLSGQAPRTVAVQSRSGCGRQRGTGTPTGRLPLSRSQRCRLRMVGSGNPALTLVPEVPRAPDQHRRGSDASQTPPGSLAPAAALEGAGRLQPRLRGYVPR